jgi:C-terminal processing protease CtpA/Prc
MDLRNNAGGFPSASRSSLLFFITAAPLFLCGRNARSLRLSNDFMVELVESLQLR